MARLDEILSILRAHHSELNRWGVLHVGVFGSVARGSETGGSAVDVAIELDRLRPIGLIEYNALGDYLEKLFGKPVDMAERTSLRNRLKSEIDRDYQHAF
jgi:predicted nucleotidyltransferase